MTRGDDTVKVVVGQDLAKLRSKLVVSAMMIGSKGEPVEDLKPSGSCGLSFLEGRVTQVEFGRQRWHKKSPIS